MTPGHDHDNDGDHASYSPVMPFVACTSKGGPYDDDAYAAGWQLGKIDEQLEQAADRREWSHIVATVFTTNVEQADLVAMCHGFSSSVTETHDGGWSDVMFSPPVEWRPDDEAPSAKVESP